jgi:hypothetical protein
MLRRARRIENSTDTIKFLSYSLTFNLTFLLDLELISKSSKKIITSKYQQKTPLPSGSPK